jgi:hypothetical protein
MQHLSAVSLAAAASMHLTCVACEQHRMQYAACNCSDFNTYVQSSCCRRQAPYGFIALQGMLGKAFFHIVTHG